VKLAVEVLAEVGGVGAGRVVELDEPVAAEVVLDPGLADPEVEDVASDLAVVGEEVPVVAGDVQAGDPGGAAEADEGPGDVPMGPDGLALGDLGQGLVGRLLAADAPDGDRGEPAADDRMPRSRITLSAYSAGRSKRR